MIRTSAEPRRVIYGERIVSGPLVFVTTTGPTIGAVGNTFLHLVIPLAGHEVDHIGEVFFGAESLDLNDGLTRLAGFQRIKRHLGADGQAADADLIAETNEWSGNHRLRGIAYTYARLQFDRDAYPNGIPNIKAVVRGRKVFDPRTSTTGWTDNAALVLRDYLVSEHGLGADAATEIDDAAAIAAANICDEEVTLPAATPGFNFTADPASNVCTQFVPAGQRPLALDVGDGIELTTTGALPAPLVAGTRYYAVPLTATKFFLATSLANARASASSGIDLTDAGAGNQFLTRKSQPRYTSNGVISLDARPVDIVPPLIAAMHGALVYAGGLYVMTAGAYTGPATVTLTESDLRAEIKVRPRPGKRDLHNAVRGVFTDRANGWQPTDFVPQTNAAWEAADGARLFKDIELANVTDQMRAQRLAKLTNERDRQGIVVEFPAKLTALRLAVMDTVAVTIARLGWSAKEFEVIDWKLSTDLGVDLVLKETAAAVYAWDPDADASVVDPAPNTALPAPYAVETPGLTLSDDVVAPTAGALTSRLIVDLTAPADAFVAAFEVQGRKVGAPDWIDIGLGTATRRAMSGVEDGATYEVRARAVNGLGARSTWVMAQRMIVGSTAPPADVTGLALNIVGDQAYLSWDPVADLDLSHYRLRFAAVTTGASWAGASDLVAKIAGPATSIVAPALVGTYLIKAVDLGGRESTAEASVASAIASLQNLNVVATQTEDPGWTGTKTDVVLNVANLELAATKTAGDYQFSGPDLGAVYTSRVSSTMTVSGAQRSDLWDDLAQLWDDLNRPWDGTAPTATDVALDIRTTQDDPAGAPVWSAWTTLVAGDYTARAHQFRVRFAAPNANETPVLSALTVQIDMPDRTLSGAGVVTLSTGVKSIAFSPAFKAVPAIAISVRDGASGDRLMVTNQTASGCDVEVFSSGGARVVRAVDWIAKGYGRSA